jgi:glycosyltransferase involved in cell wall biosynthesis
MDNLNPRIIINASNLHYGGGIQVAVSFFWELLSLDADCFEVVVSREVDSELKQLGADVALYANYHVHDSFGLMALFDLKLRRLLSSADVIFTVFGPMYCLLPNSKEVVGFAQPWIIYPDNEIFKRYNFYLRVKTRLKFFVQKLFYLKSHLIVVEQEHVKEGLEKISKRLHIKVVNNCLSSVFGAATSTEQTRTPDDIIKLGYLTRDYPHKNLDILPKVAQTLKNEFGIKAQFFVTLTDDEWFAKSAFFRENVINFGSCSVEDCPSFYKSIDGVVCTSLLECFSATPLEAMCMKRPVFVSDRGFFRDSCGDYAVYFDPLNADNIAECIFHYFSQSKTVQQLAVDESYKYALNFCNPNIRAVAYIDLMREAL